jgi:hypothetical protein
VATLALSPLSNAKARVQERWRWKHFPEYAGYKQWVRRYLPWIYYGRQSQARLDGSGD